MRIVRDEEQLKTCLSQNALVIVQFGAESCQPCHAIQEKICSWCAFHPQAVYLYLPTEECPTLCAQWGVFTVPTVCVYVAGKLAVRESGYFSLEDLLRKTARYEQML